MKKRSISVCFPVAVILLLSHTAFGQIRTARQAITKASRINAPKTAKSQPEAENESQPSDARNTPADKSVSVTPAVLQEPPGLLNYFLSEISEAKKDVEIYDPGTRLYLVKAVQEEWLLRAVSPRARTEHCDGYEIRGMAARQSCKSTRHRAR